MFQFPHTGKIQEDWNEMLQDGASFNSHTRVRYKELTQAQLDKLMTFQFPRKGKIQDDKNDLEEEYYVFQFPHMGKIQASDCIRAAVVRVSIPTHG